MKKLFAIFLFTLFLFNIIGYRIVYFIAAAQEDAKLQVSLDENRYDTVELITIKVPLFLPYQNDQVSFERVDGEISVNGKIYKYVKRKISEGNLVLLCLPDYNKMRLTKKKDDFFKDVNSLAQNAGSKKQENSKGNSVKNTINDYDQFYPEYLPVLFAVRVCNNFCTQVFTLTTAPHTRPDQPPELV